MIQQETNDRSEFYHSLQPVSLLLSLSALRTFGAENEAKLEGHSLEDIPTPRHMWLPASTGCANPNRHHNPNLP